MNFIETLKSFTVSDVMTKPVVCTHSDISAFEIMEKFKDSHFSGMPVVENNSIVGIVSEKDILYLCLQNKNLRRIPASDFMTRDIITADKNSLLLPAVKTILDYQILRLPVTHEEKIVGIVTRHDVLKVLADSTHDFTQVC